MGNNGWKWAPQRSSLSVDRNSRTRAARTLPEVIVTIRMKPPWRQMAVNRLKRHDISEGHQVIMEKAASVT
jgi:hypothetical protein